MKNLFFFSAKNSDFLEIDFLLHFRKAKKVASKSLMDFMTPGGSNSVLSFAHEHMSKNYAYAPVSTGPPKEVRRYSKRRSLIF